MWYRGLVKTNANFIAAARNSQYVVGLWRYMLLLGLATHYMSLILLTSTCACYYSSMLQCVYTPQMGQLLLKSLLKRACALHCWVSVYVTCRQNCTITIYINLLVFAESFKKIQVKIYFKVHGNRMMIYMAHNCLRSLMWCSHIIKTSWISPEPQIKAIIEKIKITTGYNRLLV